MLEYSETTGRRIWNILTSHHFQVYATDYHISIIAFQDDWKQSVGQVILSHSWIHINAKPYDIHGIVEMAPNSPGWHWADAFYAAFSGLGAMLTRCIKENISLVEGRPGNVPADLVDFPNGPTYYIDLTSSNEDPMPAALLELYGVRDFRVDREGIL